MGICRQLRQLHEQAGRSAYMPRVGLLTVPPGKNGSARAQLRRELNQLLRVASQEKAPWRQCLVDLEDVDVSMTSDGVHYTAEGYDEFAARAFAVMQPFLAAQQS